MAGEIRAEIILELDRLKRQLQDAEDESKKKADSIGTRIGKSIESSIGGISKQVAIVAAAGLAAVGASIAKAVSEASAAEQAVTRFNSALTAAGAFTSEATTSFQNYAAGLQSVLGVSDDLIVSNAALLVSIGKLSGDGLERGTKAALDLSAALGISLESATELVAKAAAGNIATLNRYGLSISKARDDSQTFANALGAIEQAFGGAALAKANTFSGTMDRLGLSFNDIFEELGKIIIRSPKLVTAIGFIAEQFLNIANGIEAIGKGKQPVDDLLQSFVEFGSGIVQYVLPPLELFFNLVKTGLGAIKTTVLAVGGLFSDSLAEKAKLAFNDLSESANNVLNFDISSKVQELASGMVTAVQNAKPLVTEASRQLAQAVSAPMLSAGQIMRDSIGEAMADIAVKTDEAATRISATLKARLVGAFDSFKLGVANSFASIGSALVKGQNAFAAFGKALLGVFGDLAIQIGTFYFLLGLANLFLNPAAAAAEIAGGIALIALGGALKALAGGGGGGGAAAPASGSSASPAEVGGAGLVGAQAGELEQRETTQVTVNVQGNILDRKESGLAIAEILNETFGGQGVVLATAR